MENEAEQQSTEKPEKSFSKFIIRLVGVIVVVIAIIGLTIFVVRVKPELLGLSSESSRGGEVEQLLSEIDRFVELPKDEVPTVATVTDQDKVKEEIFFKNALNGDKILIYTNAKKALLYRPSEKRIIEFSSINLQPETPQPSPAEISTPQPSPTSLPTQTP